MSISLVTFSDVPQTTIDHLGHLGGVTVKGVWFGHRLEDLVCRQGGEIGELDRADPLAQQIGNPPDARSGVLPIAEARQHEGVRVTIEVVEEDIGLRQIRERNWPRRFLK